jgi:hypothetical protein
MSHIVAYSYRFNFMEKQNTCHSGIYERIEKGTGKGICL